MELVQPIRDKKKIESIKKILKSDSIRNYCLFTLGINSGLRISDLLSLKILDVTDEKGKIKDRISLHEKKTGKYKDFPIGDTARKALEEYLNSRKDYQHEEPLFISRKHKEPLRRHQANKIINDAALTVGIKDNIGTHTLRKTFGYHAYQSGIDITLLQKLFNHSAPSITLAYIGITQDDMDDVYLNLNL
jgi:integrase